MNQNHSEKTMILACETIKDELALAIRLTDANFDTAWVESGLHNSPNRLRTVIQSQLEAISGYSRVLLAFGSCGNAMAGLVTGNYELIMPKVDDCISLLIGSIAARMDFNKKGGIYFLTPGWLRGERNLWAEYCYTIEKYGEQKAERILKSMLDSYTYLGLLDTNSYDMAEIMPEIDRIAAALKLTRTIIPASVTYLCDLLTGPWDADRFLRVPANSEILESDLLFIGEVTG